jgi:hypothetical protein
MNFLAAADVCGIGLAATTGGVDPTTNAPADFLDPVGRLWRCRPHPTKAVLIIVWVSGIGFDRPR